MSNIRILVVDDHEIVRHAVRLIIEEHSGWEVCGEAADATQAMALAERLKPEIVVVDLKLPGLPGIDLARQLKNTLPETRIVIFTGHAEPNSVRQSFQAGVHAYVLKSDADKDLKLALEALVRGETFFSPKASALVAEYFLAHGNEEAEDKLTRREIQILRLVAEGKSSKEIGIDLGISHKTVETHRTNLMQKVGARSLSDLVLCAVRKGLVDA